MFLEIKENKKYFTIHANSTLKDLQLFHMESRVNYIGSFGSVNHDLEEKKKLQITLDLMILKEETFLLNLNKVKHIFIGNFGKNLEKDTNEKLLKIISTDIDLTNASYIEMVFFSKSNLDIIERISGSNSVICIFPVGAKNEFQEMKNRIYQNTTH